MSASSAIQNQINALAAELNREIAVQNDYSRRGAGALQKTYKGLADTLTKQYKDTALAGNKAIADTWNNYNTSINELSQKETDLQDLIGLDAYVRSDDGFGVASELARLAGEAKLSRADSNASLQMLTSGHNAAARTAIGDAHKEGAQAQKDLYSQVGAEIGELQRTYNRDRMAMEVQLAQTLAEERHRAAQLALERQRLAAENAARAASQAASAQRFKGREGLMAWAAQNNIPKEELNLMLSAINRAGVTGDPATAYQYINEQIAMNTGRGKSTFFNPMGELISKYRAVNGSRARNLDMANTGLDIYFGNYASYE